MTPLAFPKPAVCFVSAEDYAKYWGEEPTMSTTLERIAERAPDATAIEQALIAGDLAKLTPAQRVSYYNRVCESLELNPLTKPFAYITLNGKLTLYALKDCTEQLRDNRGISISIKAREVVEGCYVVTASASRPTGRTDESIGAVPIDGLKGEARANAMMKAETKAKRRVTLSICGLGMLDETEVGSIDPHTLQTPTPVVGSGNPERETAVRRGGEIQNGPSIDTATGQELPAGYHLIAAYEYKAPWHELVVKGLDAQGGSMKLSTKSDAGFAAEQAWMEQRPVRIDWKPKGPRYPGEGYLNRVSPLAETLPDIQIHEQPVDDDEVPF